MNFKGWRRTSLIEYPGKICTVLFTGGCNFRCPFCYNGDLVDHPETLPDIPEDQIMSYLAENRRLYQALAVTGGEPTLQPGLPSFLAGVKSRGLAVHVETNGTHPEMLRHLLDAETVDYISLDVKAPLEPARYAEAAGTEDVELFDKVRESVELLKGSGDLDYAFRLTVVPELHTEERVLALGEQLAGGKRFVLQQFVPKEALDPAMRKRKPYPKNFLEQLARRINEKLPCTLREF
jgi:pyruvate formate lyase activating enzyme